MRQYPLCPIEQSFDRIRFTRLSADDTRALFEQLGRAWCLCPGRPENRAHHEVVLDGTGQIWPDSPPALVAALVDHLENGGSATLVLQPALELTLRRVREPTQFAAAPPDPFVDLVRS